MKGQSAPLGKLHFQSSDHLDDDEGPHDHLDGDEGPPKGKADVRRRGRGGSFHKLNYSDRRHFWLNVIWPNLAIRDRPFWHISHESGNSHNFNLKKNAEVEHSEPCAVDLTCSKSISGLGIRVVRYCLMPDVR